MAAVSVRVVGAREYQRALRKLNPRQNPEPVGRALLKAAFKLQEIAATEKIKRGGSGPPLPRILTSRTGTLRRSIGVDRTELPFSVSVGTPLVYGAVHELGGRYHPQRPFLAPAAADVAKILPGIIEREWSGSV